MFKKIIIGIILSGVSLTPALAETDSCQEQLSDINAKLENALKNGNIADQNNLKIARNKINTYCTEERQTNRAM